MFGEEVNTKQAKEITAAVALLLGSALHVSVQLV